MVENISIPTEMQQRPKIPPGLKVKVFSHTDQDEINDVKMWKENNGEFINIRVHVEE